MEKEYQKSWKGFVIWLVVFVAALAGVMLLPLEDGALVSRLILLLMLWWIQALTVQIFLTEQVYWYNGVEFEDAKAAGSERRRAYAWAHVKRCGWATLLGTAVTLLAQLLRWPVWLDMIAVFVLLMAAAFSTIRFKL